MNWEAIGAVGEIAGVIAVIVTLLFVAREIRLNARSLAMTALRDSTHQWNQWSEMIASSQSLADIVARGNVSFASLRENEKLRYAAYVQSFFDNTESYRSLVIDYEVDRDLDVLVSIVRRRLQIPGFCEWWQDYRDDYGEDFQNWVDAHIAAVRSNS